MGIFLLPKSLGLNFQAISIGTNNFAKSTFIESIPFNQSPIHEIVSTMGRILIIVWELFRQQKSPKTEMPRVTCGSFWFWDPFWYQIDIAYVFLSLLMAIRNHTHPRTPHDWVLLDSATCGASCVLLVTWLPISVHAVISNWQWSLWWESVANSGHQVKHWGRIHFSSLVILCYCGCHLG